MEAARIERVDEIVEFDRRKGQVEHDWLRNAMETLCEHEDDGRLAVKVVVEFIDRGGE